MNERAISVLRAIVEEVAGHSQPYSADSYLPAHLIHDARHLIEHHERRELVNTLTKIAREYGQTQQLRERIAHALPWDCDVDERGKTHAFTFEEIESFEAAFQEYFNLKQMGPLEDNVFMSNFLTGSKTK